MIESEPAVEPERSPVTVATPVAPSTHASATSAPPNSTSAVGPAHRLATAICADPSHPSPDASSTSTNAVSVQVNVSNPTPFTSGTESASADVSVDVRVAVPVQSVRLPNGSIASICTSVGSPTHPHGAGTVTR